MTIGEYDNFQDGGGGKIGSSSHTDHLLSISKKPDEALAPNPKLKLSELESAMKTANKLGTNYQDACDHGNESPYVNGSKGGNTR